MTHAKTITVTATEAAEALFRNHVEPGIQAMTPTQAIQYLEAIIELATEMLYSDSEGDNTELPNQLEPYGE